MLVAECFSPSRVTAKAGKIGHRGGWALDLNHADPVSGRRWDLSLRADQEAAVDLIDRDQQYLVTLCPPCTVFSTMQNANPNKGSEEWNATW